MLKTTYIATVWGLAWAGYKATCDYNFDHRPTRKEVIAAAGDFQGVTRILLWSRTVTEKREKLAVSHA